LSVIGFLKNNGVLSQEFEWPDQHDLYPMFHTELTADRERKKMRRKKRKGLSSSLDDRAIQLRPIKLGSEPQSHSPRLPTQAIPAVVPIPTSSTVKGSKFHHSSDSPFRRCRKRSLESLESDSDPPMKRQRQGHSSSPLADALSLSKSDIPYAYAVPDESEVHMATLPSNWHNETIVEENTSLDFIHSVDPVHSDAGSSLVSDKDDTSEHCGTGSDSAPASASKKSKSTVNAETLGDLVEVIDRLADEGSL